MSNRLGPIILQGVSPLSEHVSLAWKKSPECLPSDSTQTEVNRWNRIILIPKSAFS